MAVDYNVSYFTHPMMKDGCSLASPDDAVRAYWVRAGINGRRICEAIGRELGCTVFNNTWTPDGVKDNTVDRMGYRARRAARQPVSVRLYGGQSLLHRQRVLHRGLA